MTKLPPLKRSFETKTFIQRSKTKISSKVVQKNLMKIDFDYIKK